MSRAAVRICPRLTVWTRGRWRRGVACWCPSTRSAGPKFAWRSVAITTGNQRSDGEAGGGEASGGDDRPAKERSKRKKRKSKDARRTDAAKGR
eukprot:scaffold69935_cov47-Phaeocystis_antarctica.AAC.3